MGSTIYAKVDGGNGRGDQWQRGVVIDIEGGDAIFLIEKLSDSTLESQTIAGEGEFLVVNGPLTALKLTAPPMPSGATLGKAVTVKKALQWYYGLQETPAFLSASEDHEDPEMFALRRQKKRWKGRWQRCRWRWIEARRQGEGRRAHHEQAALPSPRSPRRTTKTTTTSYRDL